MPLEERIVTMGRGLGWMGQTPWWTPPDFASPEIGRFLERVTALLEDGPTHDEEAGSVTERRLYRLHRIMERNSRAALLAKRHHGFRCQSCEFDFRQAYGALGDGFIEAHHLRPLASLKEGVEAVYDVVTDSAVLCANCHRMIHRMSDPSDLQGLQRLVAEQRLHR